MAGLLRRFRIGQRQKEKHQEKKGEKSAIAWAETREVDELQLHDLYNVGQDLMQAEEREKKRTGNHDSGETEMGV